MKTRWSRVQAAKHIEALLASGKSVEGFAAEHQLPAQRLRYWQKRLASAGAKPVTTSVAPVLLPVRVKQPVVAPIELVVGAGCVSAGFVTAASKNGADYPAIMDQAPTPQKRAEH